MSTASDKLQPTENQSISAQVEYTRPGSAFTPAVDIFEGEDSITLEADMPGVSAEALQVDLREGVLTLRGEVDPMLQEGEGEVHHEFDSGTFYRQFRLSDRIDQARIDARLIDGVLTLKLPKSEAAKPRQIAVQTS